MTTDWVLQAISQLNVRDEIEKKESAYFNAFKQLQHTLNQQKGANIEGESTSHVNHEADKDVVIDKMNGLYFTIEKLNDKLAQSSKTIKQLEKENRAQLARIESLVLEVSEKNRAIETINDELLSLNIQNNVLSGKVVDLERENETLVKRWMDRVKQDVEKLNEANEKLEKERERDLE